MSQVDMYLKLENARKALENARKKYTYLRQENDRLIEELNKYRTWEIEHESFNTKKSAVERNCIYGFVHFCDGTVNRSYGGRDIQPLPQCPQYFKCPIRANKLKEIKKHDKG